MPTSNERPLDRGSGAWLEAPDADYDTAAALQRIEIQLEELRKKKAT